MYMAVKVICWCVSKYIYVYVYRYVYLYTYMCTCTHIYGCPGDVLVRI